MISPKSVRLQIVVPRAHAERFARVVKRSGQTVSAALRKHIVRVSHAEILRVSQAELLRVAREVDSAARSGR